MTSSIWREQRTAWITRAIAAIDDALGDSCVGLLPVIDQPARARAGTFVRRYQFESGHADIAFQTLAGWCKDQRLEQFYRLPLAGFAVRGESPRSHVAVTIEPDGDYFMATVAGVAQLNSSVPQ